MVVNGLLAGPDNPRGPPLNKTTGIMNSFALWWWLSWVPVIVTLLQQ